VELGCPLNNLAQEMSPLDTRFRRAVDAIYADWRAGAARVLARGQAEGSVRSDVNPAEVAAFVVAAVEGSYGLAKGSNDGELLRKNFRMLELFLEGLRSVAKPTT
jgi:TetR/AcrR family transcriptional regulator, transcriptional repressor for nem operon